MHLPMVLLRQLAVIILKVITALVSPHNVCYVPFTSSYETGAFTYGVTVSWIRVTDPGNIVPVGFGGSGRGAGGGDGGIGAFGCAGDSRKGASKPADS